MIKNFYLTLVVVCCLGFNSSAQQILNGSFESATGSCQLNITNARFNTLVTDGNAFGLADQLDVLNDSCSFGSAQHGRYFVGIATDTNKLVDGLALRLSAPLITGQNYTLSFYVRKDANYAATPYMLGYSSDSDRGGYVIKALEAPTDAAWQLKQVNFMALTAARFITIVTSGNTIGWTHIDNFSLTSVPNGVGEEPVAAPVFSLFPNPASSSVTIKLTDPANTDATVHLLDITGKMIRTLRNDRQANVTIDLNDVSAGTYLIKVSSKGQVYSKLLTVSK